MKSFLCKYNWELLGSPVHMLYGTDICLYYWNCDINSVLTCATNTWSSRYVKWSKYISLYMLVFTDMYPFTFLTSYMSERSVCRRTWCTVTNCRICFGLPWQTVKCLCGETDVDLIWPVLIWFWVAIKLYCRSTWVREKSTSPCFGSRMT